MKNKIFFLFLFATFLYTKSYSQIIMVNDKISTGKLQWGDFTGKIEKGSSFNAYTAYKFKTKYDNIKAEGETIIFNNFQVVLELNQSNSWVKDGKQTPELLKHEQGHFNLGILCAKEIMEKFKGTKFTKSNYSTLMQSLITDTGKKYNEMGIKYDEETSHSKDTEKQIKWNTFFEEQLGKML